MADWFGNLVAEALLGRWSLRDAQLFLDGLQRAATTAAILVGGSWAYMKFVRGEALNAFFSNRAGFPRLDPRAFAGVVRRVPVRR